MIKTSINLESKLADHVPPDFISLILNGSPELFDLEVDGEKIEAVSFRHKGQECDCYFIEPLFLKQVDADKVFDNFPDLIAAIAEDMTATLPTPKTMTDFDRNGYETPDKEAHAIAKLVLPTDEFILEPFAGTGQIAKAIIACNKKKYYGNRFTLPKVVVNELNCTRFKKLLEVNYCEEYYNRDYFTQIPDCEDHLRDVKYDLIITNPPFVHALKGIAHSLTLLNDKPESRLLFLMPMDTLCSQGRSEQFKALDCHVSSISVIPGRIDYLKDGVPMSKCQKIKDGIPQFNKDGKPIMNSGRQVSDAVFEIKKGKGNFFTFLEV